MIAELVPPSGSREQPGPVEPPAFDLRQCFAGLLATAPGLVYVYDYLERKNLYANQHLAHFLGLDESACGELPESIILSRTHPEDRARLLEVTARLKQQPRGSVDVIEFRLLNRSGEYLWVEHRAQVAQWTPDGRPHILVGHTTSLGGSRMPLRQELTLAHAIFEHSPVPIEVYDRDGYLLRMNDAYRQLLGLPHRDYGVGVFNILTHPAMIAEGHAEAFSKVFAGETLHRTRVQINLDHPQNQFETSKDPKDIDQSIFPLHNEAGEVEAVVSFIHDHTRGRKMETAVRQSETRFRAIFETIEDGILLIDEAGVIQDVNPAAVALFGYAAQELIGEPLGVLMPEQDRARHDEYLRRHAQTGARRAIGVGMESVGRRKDGRPFPIRISLGEWRLDGKRYFTGIVQNITDRLQAERERREVAQIVEKSSDFIVVMSLEGQVQYLNPRGVQILGHTHLDQLRGRAFAEFLAPQEYTRFHEEILASVAAGTSFSGELNLRIPQEGRVEVLAVLFFLLTDELTGQPRAIAAVNRVVTEQKRLEQQFRQAQKMDAVGRLAGGVAHDFNNLLTVINGYCELLSGDAAVPVGHRDLIQEIHQAGLRAAGLTRQLLAFSRNSVVRLVPLHLGQVVTGMQRMLTRLIGEDIRVEIIAPGRLSLVQADPGQIEQVILNLAVNARDAIAARGWIRIETADAAVSAQEARLYGDAATEGDYVRMTVRDNGSGIPEEVRPHLFEPFYTTKGQGKGTGLGLATVFGIVRQFHGFIRVESITGRGTAFHLYFPALPNPQASSHVDTPAGGLQAPRGEGSILLVEDDPGVRRLTRMILQQLGYRVLEAEDGERALDRVRSVQGKLDLVITDVVMPALNGRELIDLIRPRYPDIKVLFISGYTDDAILRTGISTESVAFLQKPFTSTAIARKVHEILAANQESDQPED